jgi:hypothetical protein
MSPPTNLPDGTEVSEIVLPDGASASEVIAPDGSTVFSAIPDSSIARYEFEGDFTDSLGSFDGSGINTPTFTTNSAVGEQAVSLNNAKNETVDLPTYPDSFFDSGSVAGRLDVSEDGYYYWFGTDSSNEARALQLTNNQYKWVAFGSDFDTGVSPKSGYNLITVTWNAPDGTATVYRNDANEIGSSSKLTLTAPSSQENAFGERQSDNSFHVTGLFDDVRTYDKTLSTTEISNLFNNGSIDG